MSAPAAINNDTIPEELRDRTQWVQCDYEIRNGKRTKVPKQPGGANAATNKPETWSSFEAVADAEQKGFVLTTDDGYFAIDLDGAYDPDTGEIADWAAAILAKFPNAYMEFSPSATGFHIFTRGTLPEGRGRKVPVTGAPAVGEHIAAVEAYDRGRYFTVTGNAYQAPGCIGADPEGLAWLVETYLQQPARPAKAAATSLTLSDSELIQRACNAANGAKFTALWIGDRSGYPSDSEADAAFLGMLDFWTADPAQKARILRNSGLYREKHDRDDYVARTIAATTGSGPRFGDGIRKAITSATGRTGVALPTAPDWPMPPHEAAFYGLAGDIVRAVDPFTEADPVAVLVNILAGIGASVGPLPHAMVGATRHPARDFFGIVGRSGKSRKGDSQAPVSLILEAAEPGFRTRLTSGLSTGEGLIAVVRDPVEKTEKNKRTGELETVIVDDGVIDKRLLIVEPELGRVLRVLDRQGNTLSMVVRDAWDWRDLEVLTKTKARATTPHITLIGHITLEELQRELDANTAANGFGNRFIWLAVKRSKELPLPEPFTGPIVRDLADRVAESLAAARHIGRMQFDEQAADVWINAYHELSAERDGLAGAILNRSEAHTLRLSMIYALLDGSRVIRLDHLAAAMALFDYAERSTYYIFGAASGDPVADRILEALRTIGPMSRSQVSDLFDRNTDKRTTDSALQRLKASGKAESWTDKQEGQAGRPPEMWGAR